MSLTINPSLLLKENGLEVSFHASYSRKVTFFFSISRDVSQLSLKFVLKTCFRASVT